MFSDIKQGREYLPILMAIWVLALVCVLAAVAISVPQYRLEYKAIHNQHGKPLWIIIYWPEPQVTRSVPAVVICQPFNDPPEYAHLLALELVHDGFVVLTFDWRGQNIEENRQLLRNNALPVLQDDVTSSIAHLRTSKSIDPMRIMVAGHSVGGTLAILSGAADPTIAGVVSIGMEADVTPESPRNLLWAQGLYDEFRVLNHMREVFQASTHTVAMEETIVGDFKQGTARMLGVSGTADHFTELQDSGIHRMVVDWFRLAAGMPPNPRFYFMELRSLLLLVAWIASLLGAIMTLRIYCSPESKYLRLIPIFSVCAMICLSHVSGGYFLYAADGNLWALVLALLAGFIVKRPAESFRFGVLYLAKFFGILWASLLLTLMVNNIGNYIQHPRFLVLLPEFAIRHALDGLYAYVLVYTRPLVFSLYSPQGMDLRYWVFLIPVIEIINPGILLGSITWAMKFRTLEIKPSVDTIPVKRTSLISIVFLVFLLGGLVTVSWLRLQQGFLTAESAIAALRFLMRFTVLPVLIFSFLWRVVTSSGKRIDGPPSGELDSNS